MALNINELIWELIDADPELKGKEIELKEIIEKMIANKPDISLDKKSKARIKAQLLREEKKRKKILPFRKLFTPRRMMAAATVLSATLIITIIPLMLRNDNSLTFDKGYMKGALSTDSEVQSEAERSYESILEETDQTEEKPAEQLKKLELADIADQDEMVPLQEKDKLMEREKEITDGRKMETTEQILPTYSKADNPNTPYDDSLSQVEVQSIASGDIQYDGSYINPNGPPGSEDQLPAALKDVDSGIGNYNESRVTSDDSKSNSDKPLTEGITLGFESSGLFELELQPFLDSSPVVEEYNTEAYSYIEENDFTPANQLSTFSIDVDTASYANVRRYLNVNRMPPADAVRIEELINYFEYDYPQPVNNEAFSINTELGISPWNKKNLVLHIGIQGKNIAFENTSPNNIVFLIDVSGSMSYDDKLPLLKEALALMVENMRVQDTIAIVTYSGSSEILLDPTSGDQKDQIFKALDQLSSGGLTAGSKGIEDAYELAEQNLNIYGNNRIIMATDGDFNVGISSEGDLTRLIVEKRKTGIYLTVLGFGTGNLQDNKMELLADRGNGNYSYIDSLAEAKKVLVDQLGSTFFTIAKDVKIQVDFNPAIVKSYRLIGYENRTMAAEDFADDSKDAGELGAGHSVTAIYEIELADGISGTESESKYTEETLTEDALTSNEIASVLVRYKKPDSFVSTLLLTAVLNEPAEAGNESNDLTFASAVALWGMLLRDSAYSGDGNYEMVLDLASESVNDKHGYRLGFIELVNKSKTIDKTAE